MGKITLNAVTKSYDGKKTIIKPLSLTIEEGEFMVLVGPSGCGKSTLLRMIAGLEAVSTGQIIIDDRDVTQLEPKARGVAMVFQNYALYPHMTVAQNMGYALKIAGVAKQQIQQRIKTVAASLQLTDYLSCYPRQLSGGQRQRVAMGRAIAREPSVFLFDEPLSNLDARLRLQMRLELQQRHRRLKITSLYVTHDQVEAMTLADRVLVLNNGMVEQLGTPREIYQRPASRFVAGFIGAPAMNLLSAKMIEGGRFVRFANGSKLSLPSTVRLGQRDSVIVGIRPEHVVIAETRSALSSLFSIPIIDIETPGADHLIYGEVGSEPLIIRYHGTSCPKPGESMALSCEARHLHFFDPETGKRIE